LASHQPLRPLSVHWSSVAQVKATSLQPAASSQGQERAHQ
jgi:hypothetical protein